MRSSASQRKTVLRKPAVRGSSVVRSVKKYGKQTLRDILLSKTFHRGFKTLIVLLISGSALYGAYAFIGNKIAGDVVVSESEILERVSRHVALPSEKPIDFKRVDDAEALRTQAPMYHSLKEGDYIIIYPSMAIIYDLRNDQIVALKSTRK